MLPYHKADRFFSGNQVLVTKGACALDLLLHFTSYLTLRDALHPMQSALWLRSTGTLPMCSWFLHCLGLFFGQEIHRQSMRAGGATTLHLT